MKLLHVVATPRGEKSNTLPISKAFINDLSSKFSDLEIKEINPFFDEIPKVAEHSAEVKYAIMAGQNGIQKDNEQWKKVEALISDFLEADYYLLTIPLWNFTIPHALKAYIDAIVQPGYLFRYNEQGVPIGLVTQKKMVCICSTGGDYSPGSPMNALNFIEPYIRAIFGFVGITDIEFITAGPMNYTEEVKQMVTQGAVDAAEKIVARI
ncbi:FMN-dependent NADH-azoreductase [Portibacter marinus]|uniref:FMN-dependent NADH-azoreductase n=1 Tax=Portibacter marinus TaxID=2898660 RepID=UPI001F448646|nr:NAD(P)H-dependent oxidoreductase [Portibacter marinus]